MADCALCGGTSDDTDIINLTCSECFEIFGHAPNGTPTDMSEKIVAAADSAGGFIPINQTSYEVGPTAAISSGNDVPIFVASPTRTNGTTVYTRDSDTQITIPNAGIHTLGIQFISSKPADTFTFEIDSITWFVGNNGEMKMSFCYLFTGGEAITIQRSGSGTATITDIAISIAQMTE